MQINRSATVILAVAAAGGINPPAISAARPPQFIDFPDDMLLSHNYIRSIVPKTPRTDGIEDGALVTYDYFDGLGRNIQHVQMGSLPYSQVLPLNLPDNFQPVAEIMDIVTRTDYDAVGNVDRSWLPVPAPCSGFPLDAQTFNELSAQFYGNAEIPYTRTVYEDDVARRPIEVYSPGIDWQSHPNRFEYSLNTGASGSSQSRCLMIIPDATGAFSIPRFYAEATLRIESATDGQGRKSMRFTDKSGRTVLIRNIVSPTEFADTYFVYDIFGNLRFTLSPEASRLLGVGISASEASDIAQKLGCTYLYDSENRMISRRSPGCQPLECVYDRFDRLTAWQDGVDRENGRWHVVKRDAKGRKAVEGFITNPAATRAYLQQLWGDTELVETQIGYDNESQMGYTETLGGFSPYRAWYYDNYNFLRPGTGTVADQQFTASNNFTTVGMPTGEAYTDGATVYVRATYYDDYGRTARTVEEDYNVSYRLCNFFNYDFRGNITATKVLRQFMIDGEVNNSASPYSAMYTYTYDNADRLVRTSLSIDGADPLVMESQTYDDIGRVASRSSAGITTSFAYDIASRLVSLASPIFSQSVFFGNNPYNSSLSEFSGLACASVESYPSAGISLSMTYAYDNLARMTSMQLADGYYSDEDYTPFSESLSYDLNANPLTIRRRWEDTSMQDAVMQYDGNQIASLYDQGTDVYLGSVPGVPSGIYDGPQYDANGRPTNDPSRAIAEIIYHPWLPLPQKVTFDNGNTIQFTYCSDGSLKDRRYTQYLITRIPTVNRVTGDTTWVERRRVLATKIHSFCGPYESISGVGMRLHTSAGFYDYPQHRHYYAVRDRLGSTRCLLGDSAQIVQAVLYYPSGVPVDITAQVNPGVSGARTTDRLHIGNTWIDYEGIGWYDNRARYHDPLLAHFTTQDAMITDYPHLSPYSHCAADPINKVDPSGMELIILFDRNVENNINTNLDMLLSNSIIFNRLYQILDNSSEKISIKIGITESMKENHATGAYNPETKTITIKEDVGSLGLIEELYHAYQDISNSIATDNIEFEAKTFAIFAANEAGLLTRPDEYIKDWSNYLLEGSRYSTFEPKPQITDIQGFEQEYIIFGNKFVNHKDTPQKSDYIKNVSFLPFQLMIFLNWY